jgi:DNA-binding LacI/PurR family transcriptional regulator
VGLSVPRDVSIISFDNSVECRNFPVSTIDFGFSRLGYRAAHVFIGDIPVKADRYGNVPGICTLVDRGSIGKPADSTAIAKTLRTGTGGVPIAAPVLF